MSDPPTLDELRRFAKRLVLALARRTRSIRDPEDLAEDLAQRAIVALERTHREDTRAVSCSVAFVRTVVTNAFIDEYRTVKRRAHLRRVYGGDLGPALPRTPDAGEADRTGAGSGDCLVAYLTAVQVPGWASGRAKVNFAAVFLVHLRFALVRAAQRARLDLDAEDLIRIAEQTAPWPRRACSSAFYQGWPGIQTLWAAAAARIPSEPSVLEAKGFTALVCSMLDPDATPLTEAQWQQWCFRARLRARELLPDDVWKECFEPLFPPRVLRAVP